MSERSFELITSTKYLEMFAEYIEAAMKKYGYSSNMEFAHPHNPQIWEFSKGDEIIAVSIAPHEGTLSGESKIIIETENEKKLEEIYEIVGETVSMMVTNYSEAVIKAIKSKKGKLAVFSRISKQLEKIKKDI